MTYALCSPWGFNHASFAALSQAANVKVVDFGYVTFGCSLSRIQLDQGVQIKSRQSQKQKKDIGDAIEAWRRT